MTETTPSDIAEQLRDSEIERLKKELEQLRQSRVVETIAAKPEILDNIATALTQPVVERPQPTAPLSSLEGQKAGYVEVTYLGVPNVVLWREADGTLHCHRPRMVNGHREVSVITNTSHYTDFSPLYTPEQLAERVEYLFAERWHANTEANAQIDAMREQDRLALHAMIDQLREQLAAQSAECEAVTKERDQLDACIYRIRESIPNATREALDSYGIARFITTLTQRAEAAERERDEAEGKNSQLYVEHGRVLAKYKAERDRIKQQLAQSEAAAAAMRAILQRLPDGRTGSKAGRADYCSMVGGDVLWDATTLLMSTDAGRGWLSPAEAERLRGEWGFNERLIAKYRQFRDELCKEVSDRHFYSGDPSPQATAALDKWLRKLQDVTRDAAPSPVPPSESVETVREYNARIAVTGESPSTLAELAKRAAEVIWPKDTLYPKDVHSKQAREKAERAITATFAPEWEQLQSQLTVAAHSLDALRVSQREAAAERDRLRSVLGPSLTTIINEYIATAETAGRDYDADVGRKVLGRIEGAMGGQTTSTKGAGGS